MNAYCEIHTIEMREFSKGGNTWYSHKLIDGTWCNGKPKPGYTKTEAMQEAVQKESDVDSEVMRKSDWELKDKRIAKIAIAKSFISQGVDFDNAMANADLEKWFDWVWNDEQ